MNIVENVKIFKKKDILNCRSGQLKHCYKFLQQPPLS